MTLHEHGDLGRLPALAKQPTSSLLRRLTRRANIEALGRLQDDLGDPLVCCRGPSVCSWGRLASNVHVGKIIWVARWTTRSTWPSTYFRCAVEAKRRERLNQVVSSTSILCLVVAAACPFCRLLCCRAATILQHQWWSSEMPAAVVPQARQLRFCSRLPLQLLHPTIHAGQSAAVVSPSLDSHPGSASARPHSGSLLGLLAAVNLTKAFPQGSW